MAIAPNGTATVVWGHTESGLDTIQAKTRRAGQDWPTDPDTISPPGQQAYFPDVAVDNLGNVTAVWKTVDGGTGFTTIQTSTKQPEGNWPSTSDTLSTSIPPGSSVVGPYIAVNLSGNSAAVWSVNDGTTTTLYASTRGLPSEPWPTTPDTLFSTDTNMAPQVAIDLSGNTTVIWGGSFPFDNTAVQALTKPFGGAWPTIPEPISSAGFKARFTIDPFGNATAVWYSNTDPIEVRASTKLFGSTWQPTADILSTETIFTTPPDIATDMFGNVTALWPNIGTAVQSATKQPLPTILTINPNIGPTEGGTSVTITGDNFSEVQNVLFGSISALQYSVVSPTSIIATAPAGTGTVDVRVIALSGTSPITVNDQYTYTNQPLPPPSFRGTIRKRTQHHKHKWSLKATWKQSDSSNISSYIIYKRSKPVKTILANAKRRFSTHLLWKKSTKKFSIVAVNSNNNESVHKRLKIVHCSQHTGLSRCLVDP